MEPYQQPYNYPNYPPQQLFTYIPYGLTPQTFHERKQIRKLALVVGISILLMTVVSVFWAAVFSFVMARLGYSGQEIYNLIMDPAVLQGAQILLSSFMFTIPYIIVFKIAGNSVSALVPLGKPKKNTALPFYLFGLGFCAFANISVSYAGSIFESFGIHYSVDFGESPKGVFGFLLTFFSTAIIPALVEEFACRGLILGSLRRFGDGFAIIVSSIIFGMMHGNFNQIPFAFLVGLVLAYITVKTGTIWIACLVHFTNNLVSVIFEYLLSNISGATQNLIYTVFLMVCLLLAILGVLFLQKNGENKYYLEKTTTACTEKQKYKWFFTSPFIIGFIVICIIEACMFF